MARPQTTIHRAYTSTTPPKLSCVAPVLVPGAYRVGSIARITRRPA